MKKIYCFISNLIEFKKEKPTLIPANLQLFDSGEKQKKLLLESGKG